MLSWEELHRDCSDCKKCSLGNTKTNVVLGRGNTNASIMFIGEAPGEQEDLQGLPFVGPAGKLLDLLLEALCFKPEDYYIANIIKCRPPNNRLPFEEEAEACIQHLRNQVLLVKPKIIVCLGGTAVKYIVNREAKVTQIRGQWIDKKNFCIMPTFHPAALLRDDSKRILMWNDFIKVRQKLYSSHSVNAVNL